MSMAYRGDVEALEARVAALSADLAHRVRERDEAAQLLAEARARANAEAYIADLDAGGPARRRRKRLRIAAMAAGIAMIVGGVVAYCARPHPDRFEEAMRTFDRFADEMCQCKDAACVTHISDDMTRWGTQMSKEMPQPKLGDAQMKRAMAIGERMGQCMQKAMSYATPQSPEE
jgi:hypothetical protein